MRLRARREKVFGPGRAVPLDRNAKCRIQVCARAWTARNRQPGQHKGPITRAFLEVLQALLWGFHNAHTGRCFPSYEGIAKRAGCARSTVAEALKVLEWAGVLYANAAPIYSAARAGNARASPQQCLHIPRPAADCKVLRLSV